MALVTEDGTGKANAEAYGTVVGFKAYCDARGISYSALDDTKIEQNLRLATDYMVEVYRASWQGNRVTSTQALDWPRLGVEADDFAVDPASVPADVAKANYALAQKVRSGPLAPDLTQRKKRVKVGPLETEYDDYSPQSKRYLSVDRMLSQYLVGARGFYSAPLERS